MKKTLFVTILAVFIGLFSTQASACGEGSCSGNCKMDGEHSCSCKNGSCNNGK